MDNYDIYNHIMKLKKSQLKDAVKAIVRQTLSERLHKESNQISTGSNTVTQSVSEDDALVDKISRIVSDPTSEPSFGTEETPSFGGEESPELGAEEDPSLGGEESPEMDAAEPIGGTEPMGQAGGDDEQMEIKLIKLMGLCAKKLELMHQGMPGNDVQVSLPPEVEEPTDDSMGDDEPEVPFKKPAASTEDSVDNSDKKKKNADDDESDREPKKKKRKTADDGGDPTEFTKKLAKESRNGLSKEDGKNPAPRKCKGCGKTFIPTYGEYARCQSCLSNEHDAGERATGTQ